MNRKQKIRARRNKRIATALVSIVCLFLLSIIGFLVSRDYSIPEMNYVRIKPGMREEEVISTFATVLNWDESEKQTFLDTYRLTSGGKTEGYYYPKIYIIPATATPQDVSTILLTTFNTEVIAKHEKLLVNDTYTNEILKIASIIQREAYDNDKEDMRLVSGVIWNRLEQGMKLEMDATLQYIKGTPEKWWPQISASDKKTDSPYNTYKYKGLPPTPISNPSAIAIEAALNPAKTSALFYIHDAWGGIHPAATYAEHKANIQLYLK